APLPGRMAGRAAFRHTRPPRGLPSPPAIASRVLLCHRRAAPLTERLRRPQSAETGPRSCPSWRFVSVPSWLFVIFVTFVAVRPSRPSWPASPQRPTHVGVDRLRRVARTVAPQRTAVAIHEELREVPLDCPCAEHARP